MNKIKPHESMMMIDERYPMITFNGLDSNSECLSIQFLAVLRRSNLIYTYIVVLIITHNMF